MMLPGTLNSSTLHASSGPPLLEGAVLLLWKILQSTDGTGPGRLGLGLALRPSDFSSRRSCGLSSVARRAPRRAQARAARTAARTERG
ncbi:hypothetical protein N309_05296, partial [Tinamus guttatus]